MQDEWQWLIAKSDARQRGKGMKLRASHIKDKKNGAIPFAKSYFFRRILAFEEATRKGSHAKKKKREIGGEVVGVKGSKSTYVCTGETTARTQQRVRRHTCQAHKTWAQT